MNSGKACIFYDLESEFLEWRNERTWASHIYLSPPHMPVAVHELYHLLLNSIQLNSTEKGQAVL